MCSYVESKVYELRIEIVKEILLNHEPIEIIIKYFRLPQEAVLELQKCRQHNL